MNLKLIRKIIFSSVIILSLGCFGKNGENTKVNGRTENKENDWKKDNLKGKVKSYTEKTYKLAQQNGSEIGKELGHFYKKFDVYGNLIEWGEYNDKNILIEKETYQYNENNDKILEERIKDTFYDKITYKYDKNNNIIEESRFRKNGTLYEQTIYKYNEKGYRILEEKYSDGNLSFITQISLDGKGNQIERSNFTLSPSGYQFANKETYRYNNNGNKVEYNWYNSEHSSRSRQTKTYNYDKNGNEIEYSLYEYGTLKVTNTSLYNDKGYLIEWTHNNSDGNLKKITKKYDDKGNEIEENFYSEGDILGKVFNKTVFKYSYDTRGNWTEKIYTDEIFKNIIVTERQFEYYK